MKSKLVDFLYTSNIMPDSQIRKYENKASREIIQYTAEYYDGIDVNTTLLSEYLIEEGCEETIAGEVAFCVGEAFEARVKENDNKKYWCLINNNSHRVYSFLSKKGLLAFAKDKGMIVKKSYTDSNCYYIESYEYIPNK